MKKTLIGIFIFFATMTIANAQNPFFSDYKTPHGTAPFDKIKNEHFEPAFDKAIEMHKSEINKLVAQRALPTFGNTILPFERSGELLSQVSSVFFNLNSSESSPEMREMAKRIQPRLTEHSNDIYLNNSLFQKIKTVYDARQKTGLTTEQIRLVEKIYSRFEQNGATLSGEDKEKYKELSTRLSQLTLTFGQNSLEETNKFEMLLTDEADLAGLPQSVVDAAKAKAESKNKSGWMFDLSAPSYIGFMQYSSRRDLREKLYRAYNTKGVSGGEFDNQEVVKQIAQTRMEIANLLGYKDFASYKLKNKMAKNPEGVYGLLDQLLSAYAVAAREDVKEVQGFAVGMEGKAIDIQPWDWSYYSNKLKDAKYNINDEMIRPYFELEKAKKGVFGLATKLFGITFKKNKDIPVYHPEVEAFEVFDKDGKFVSVLYTDFHPREGKRQGAWMSEFKGQYVDKDGNDSRPHVTIVMNFTRPAGDRPALLTFDEVNTFLHEFGHALHGMLTECNYESLSGTNVTHDFVELPSQLMENWMTEKEFLDSFAVHYKTGEAIPAELIQKLVDASNFNAGYLCYRQLSFGYLDMAWHTLTSPYTGDVKEFEQKAMSTTAVLPIVPEGCMSTSFGHIFSGGYAAGYYGYKWAEVLDADAFSLFKETGIFNQETAKSFMENILQKGDTEDPMTLYVKFRGHKPSVDALLAREGLKK